MGIVFGKTGVAEPVFETLLSRTNNCTVPYEFRRYGQRFAIETLYEKDDTSSAFRSLAGYIGVGGPPQNEGSQPISMTAPVVTAGQKIAMTAPVVTNQIEGSSTKKMQFILPAEYDSIDKIPKPKSSKVTIQEVPPAIGVVHQFSGWVKDDVAKGKVKALVKQLQEDGMDTLTESEALDKYLLWQYNPPFTVPQLRRNEVWIELSDDQVKEHLNRYSSEHN